MDASLFSTATVLTLNAQGIPAETLHIGALVALAALALLIFMCLRGYMRHQTIMNVVIAVFLVFGLYQVWRFDTFARSFISQCDTECQSALNPEVISDCRNNLGRDFGYQYVQWRTMVFGGIFDGFEYNKESKLLTLYSSRLKVGDYMYDATCAIDTTSKQVLMATYTQQDMTVPAVEQSVAE